MTFKTTERNTFKKDPLRGLEYKQREIKPKPIVEYTVMILFLIVAISTIIKIWRG